MSDIFLSYVSEDLERVRPFIQALEDHGWSVWWDRRIPPGKTFAEVIEAELEAARCVLVVWSEASVNKDWVREEVSEARDRLIPVQIDHTRPPFGFRQIQTAQLIGWQGNSTDPAYLQVVHAVSDLIGPPEENDGATASAPAHVTREDRETEPKAKPVVARRLLGIVIALAFLA